MIIARNVDSCVYNLNPYQSVSCYNCIRFANESKMVLHRIISLAQKWNSEKSSKDSHSNICLMFRRSSYNSNGAVRLKGWSLSSETPQKR